MNEEITIRRISNGWMVIFQRWEIGAPPQRFEVYCSDMAEVLAKIPHEMDVLRYMAKSDHND